MVAPQDGVQEAAKRGMAVVAMNPLVGGIMPQKEKELVFLAQDGQTPTEAALRFCISCPQITDKNRAPDTRPFPHFQSARFPAIAGETPAQG